MDNTWRLVWNQTTTHFHLIPLNTNDNNNNNNNNQQSNSLRLNNDLIFNGKIKPAFNFNDIIEKKDIIWSFEIPIEYNSNQFEEEPIPVNDTTILISNLSKFFYLQARKYQYILFNKNDIIDRMENQINQLKKKLKVQNISLTTNTNTRTQKM